MLKADKISRTKMFVLNLAVGKNGIKLKYYLHQVN
jgi:hypothetical protein